VRALLHDVLEAHRGRCAMTGRDLRRVLYALTFALCVGYGASWGVACGALSVAREAVRGRR